MRLTAPAAQHEAQTARGRVVLVAKPGGLQTGVGRYVVSLQASLEACGVPVTRMAPDAPPFPASFLAYLQHRKLDVRAFLGNYPLWASYPSGEIYHLTSQNLASLMHLRRPPGRVVVTVHDIIPYMLRSDARLCVYRTTADRVCDQLAMWGLSRAHHLLADSQYTKACLVQQLALPPERISVVYLGLDHARFQPGPGDQRLRERYGLSPSRQYLIAVGSEDPRKNLPLLLEALALARREHPELALLKVGRAHFEHERERNLTLVQTLGLVDAVHWLDDLPEADLPGLYRLAAACVQPSLYEGFGFPVLEAMACGVPTLYARASSLPELVGEAGLGFDPWQPDAAAHLAALICRVVAHPALAAGLRIAGINQAATFTWERTAAATLAAYSMGDAGARAVAIR